MLSIHKVGAESLVLFLCFVLSTQNNFFGVAVAFFAYSVFALGFRFNKIALPIILLAMLSFVHLLIPAPTDFMVRFEDAVRYLGLALFTITASRLNGDQIWNVLTLIVMVLIVPLPLFIITGDFGRFDESLDYRYTSILVHPNHVGYVSVSMIMYLVYNFVDSGYKRKYSLILILLLMAALSFSESTNAILTLAISLSVFFATRVRSAAQIFAILVATPILVILLSVTPAFADLIIKFRNIDLMNIIQGSYEYKFGGHNSSLAWRLSYWSAIIREHFQSDLHRIALGYGGGATSFGNYIYFFMYKDPHNDLLSFLIDYGLLFGSIMFVMIFYVARYSPLPISFVIAIVLPMMTGNISSSFPVIAVYILAVMGSIKSRGSR